MHPAPRPAGSEKGTPCPPTCPQGATRPGGPRRPAVLAWSWGAAGSVSWSGPGASQGCPSLVPFPAGTGPCLGKCAGPCAGHVVDTSWRAAVAPVHGAGSGLGTAWPALRPPPSSKPRRVPGMRACVRCRRHGSAVASKKPVFHGLTETSEGKAVGGHSAASSGSVPAPHNAPGLPSLLWTPFFHFATFFLESKIPLSSKPALGTLYLFLLAPGRTGCPGQFSTLSGVFWALPPKQAGMPAGGREGRDGGTFRVGPRGGRPGNGRWETSATLTCLPPQLRPSLRSS